MVQMVQMVEVNLSDATKQNKQKKRKYSSFDASKNTKGALDILPVELLEKVMKMLTFKDLMASFFGVNHETAVKVIHFFQFYPLLSLNPTQVNSRLLQYVRPVQTTINAPNGGADNCDEEFRVESGGSECGIFYFYHFFGNVQVIDLSQWQARVTDFGLEQLVALAMEKMRLKKKPIRELNISNCSLLTARSSKHLRMLMGLGLKKLVANNCTQVGHILSASNVPQISSASNFPQLIELDLSNNPQLSWRQLHTFLSLTPNLTRLNISSCLSQTNTQTNAQNFDNANLVMEFATDFPTLQCSKSIRFLDVSNTPLSLGIAQLFQNHETVSTLTSTSTSDFKSNPSSTLISTSTSAVANFGAAQINY